MKLVDLAGKQVVAWGVGREGRAVIDAIARFKISANVLAVDDSTEGDDFVGATPILRGRAAQAALQNADVVVRSPSISRYRSDVVELQSSGVEMTTATRLWFAEGFENVIGVTGTKGKSTTASLIAHLLTATGVSAELTGNIGRAPIDLLGVSNPDWWVVELSSYQTSDLDVSPLIGVLTSLSPEHLDWHGGEEQYFADKLNLFAHRDDSQMIANWSDRGIRDHVGKLRNRMRKTTDSVRVEKGWFSVDDEPIVPVEALRLLGVHNVQLACVAFEAIAATGIDLHANRAALTDALKMFRPLPHRLEIAETQHGVTYVDDSIATTPAATIAALSAFEDKSVVVLVGGYDRGLSYKELATYVAARRDHIRVIALAQSGERVATAMSEVGLDVERASTLVEGVSLAASMSEAGDVVLLSPGAPSFGLFRDYIERAEAFRAAVEEL